MVSPEPPVWCPRNPPAFVAHNDIEPTTEWQDEIERALATCDAMVTILRKGFHASRWTDQEIGYAMGRDRLILAVRLGEDPFGFIGRFQAISGAALAPAALATQVFNILKRNDKTRDRIAHGLVASFVVSDSFAKAKARTTSLAKAEYWDRVLTDRCKVALERNGQINGAHGVRDQLGNIIRRHEERFT
jgi:TIR domain